MATREEIRARPHYVNNKDFTQAVVDYCGVVKKARKKGDDDPIVPNYIAESLLRMCEGLSHKSNFVRYTYREEMVMDAVENCLKAIENYDINAETRTGKPNAFAYFTQIIWYAFLRRIQKEKRQQDIKEKYLSQSGVEAFIANELADDAATQVATHFIDTLKDRIDKVKAYDTEIKEFAKTTKKKKKRAVHVDSDLTEFLE